MNVFDYDGTIMHGDTEDYFRAYVYKHFKLKLRHRFELRLFDLLWKLRLVTAQCYRTHTYPYITYIPNLDKVVVDFWNEHEKDIFPYYYEIHQDDDVVVSATPRILLEEIMKRLKIKNLIATELDLKTGKIIGKLCRGKNKVEKYNEVFNKKPIENYYFDQDHDMYLMEYAKNGYRVFDGKLTKVK